MSEEYLLLIDGSSLLSTQFFGNLPREILYAKTPEEKEKYFDKIMMTSKGVYTNAVYGFLRTLFKILKEQKPAYLAVAWDLTRDTFRRELYPDYKGNRSDTMAPLSAQFDLCQQVLKKMNICQLMDEYYEADDFCGSAARAFEDTVPVRIYTKDHDYLQLVNDRTHLWLMHTSPEKTDEMYKKYGIDKESVNLPDRAFELDPALVKEEFGVVPEHINSLKGLQGDSSDNIKGVPGIGPQTAVRLINAYGTVDALYAALADLTKEKEDELKKYWKELGITRSPLNNLLKTSETELVGEKAARLSEELATIKTDVDLKGLTLEDMRVFIPREKVQEVLNELEFSSLSADFMADEEEETKKASAYFTLITDLEEAEKALKEIAKEKILGLSYEKEAGFAAAKEDGSCIFIPEQFFITEAFFASADKNFAEKGVRLYAMEGKPFQKLCDVMVRDVSIGAYLLDPLRSDYDYTYVADKYLKAVYPGRDSLLKKTSAKEAVFLMQEPLRDTFCYAALTALNAGPVIEKELIDEGM